MHPTPKNNIALWWGQTLSSLVCPTNVEVLATFLSSTDGFLYSFNCCSTNFYDPPSQVDEPPSFFFIQLAPDPCCCPLNTPEVLPNFHFRSSALLFWNSDELERMSLCFKPHTIFLLDCISFCICQPCMLLFEPIFTPFVSYHSFPPTSYYCIILFLPSKVELWCKYYVTHFQYLFNFWDVPTLGPFHFYQLSTH